MKTNVPNPKKSYHEASKCTVGCCRQCFTLKPGRKGYTLVISGFKGTYARDTKDFVSNVLSEDASWHLKYHVCFAFSTISGGKDVPQTLFSNNLEESPSAHWSQKSHNWKYWGENGMLKLKKQQYYLSYFLVNILVLRSQLTLSTKFYHLRSKII